MRTDAGVVVNARGRAAGLLVLVVGVLFLSPFYFVLINSVKTDAEYLDSKIAWPAELRIAENYGETIEVMRFGSALLNSALVTAASAVGIVVLGSMAAYKLARVPGRLSTVIFFLFLSIMVIPFQAVMIPIVVVVGRLGLINTIHGIVLTYWGLVTPPAIFLYHGFVKTIPVEIEESVMMDGGHDLQIFWLIVFPLLKPITATTASLLSLQVWNDFLLPLLLLQRPPLYTIQLSIMRFFQAYNTAWSNILAAVVLGSLPMLLLFAIAQRSIISGVTSGALKG
jgi:raffinose/stachyose/melibiose transport system permease protein